MEPSSIIEEEESSLSNTKTIEESRLSSLSETIRIEPNKPLFSESSSFKFNVFLYTKYQDTLETAEIISKTPASEERPFEYKYQARALLKNLLTEVEEFESSKEFRSKIENQPSLSTTKQEDLLKSTPLSPDEDLIHLTIAKGQIFYFLGLNFFESEEYTPAESHLKTSLRYFNTLPTPNKLLFSPTIQDTYNNLGIIHCNRDSHEKGLPLFTKAQQLHSLTSWLPPLSLSHSLKPFLREWKTGLKLGESRQNFGFFIDGGIDRTQMERNHTLTLFYLAQVYTKLGKNEKAVGYWAQTVRRQLETKEYDTRDWATNWVNLAEYFVENNHYAQAEYWLFAGISILPPPSLGLSEDDKELRAMMQAQIGRYYLQRLKFGVELKRKGVTIGNEGPLYDTVHKEFIDFPSLNLKWPLVTDITDIEQAKFLFRLGNTQFKKALEFFVLDGYVTDHSRITKDISDLYKYITMLEENKARIYAMYERRRDMIEPIVDAINPEAYEALWSELWVDLVNIYHEMFDLKYDELKESSKMPKKSQFDLLNSYGNGVIKHASALTKKLESLKEIEDRDSYLQAIINQRLAIGKIYSKLYDKDKSQIIEYYTKALDNYKQLEKIVNDYKTRHDLTPSLEEQLRLCHEMIDLLPVKMEKLAKS